MAAIAKFRDEQDCMDFLNQARVGLAGYFFSRDPGQIWRVAEAMEVKTGNEPEVDRKFTGNKPELDRKWTGSGPEVICHLRSVWSAVTQECCLAVKHHLEVTKNLVWDVKDL